jgi:hypothetical protein
VFPDPSMMVATTDHDLRAQTRSSSSTFRIVDELGTDLSPRYFRSAQYDVQGAARIENPDLEARETMSQVFRAERKPCQSLIAISQNECAVVLKFVLITSVETLIVSVISANAACGRP